MIRTSSNTWARKTRIVVASAAVIAVAWPGPTQGSQPQSVHPLQMPGSGLNSGGLAGVASITSDDVWAVGTANVDDGHGGMVNVTLTKHWDGQRWKRVASANADGAFDDQLLGVSAVSTDDVWAVGDTSGAWGTYGLTEHWNGNKWRVVDSANTAGTLVNLFGVDAIATNDVWAAGYSEIGTTYATFVEHWNGKKWRIVTTPNPPNASQILLEAISGDASNDVWAAGYYIDDSGEHTLVEHWDGTQWAISPTPDVAGAVYNWVPGVTALSPNDVWAVGASSDGSTADTLVEHWDGQQWTIVASPDPPGGSFLSVLLAAGGVSDNDVWAVGTASDGTTFASVTEHWNGKKWKLVPSRDRQGVGYLQGVAAAASDDVWAVGIGGSRSLPFAEHWDGSRWSTP